MALDRTKLSSRQRYLPGILGGLGPLAHVEFERAILARSHARGARGDQDHPVWLLVSASSTPPRTRALLDGGESPAVHLLHYARLLESAGADALFVACNTAHAWHAEVQRGLRVPWVHLMELVAAAARADHPAGTRIGVLATDGTLRARLYHRALEARGLVPVAPDPDGPVQAEVRTATEDAVSGIKATGAEVSAEARARLARAARWCVEQGAEAVVLGCTEVSVGLGPRDFDAVPLVDPLVLAADALLDVAAGVREPATLYAGEAVG